MQPRPLTRSANSRFRLPLVARSFLLFPCKFPLRNSIDVFNIGGSSFSVQGANGEKWITIKRNSTEICSVASISRGSKFETVGANNPRDPQLFFVLIHAIRRLCGDGGARAKYSCLLFSSISSIFRPNLLGLQIYLLPGPARHLHPLWLEWLTLFTSTALLKENSLVIESHVR